MPTASQIVDALRTNPTHASLGQKDIVHHLLKHALPAVDPCNKPTDTKTLRKAVGEKIAYNIAFAVTLMIHWNDQSNLQHNAGLKTNEASDKAPQQSEEATPKKVRRKCSVSKTELVRVGQLYYSYVLVLAGWRDDKTEKENLTPS